MKRTQRVGVVLTVGLLAACQHSERQVVGDASYRVVEPPQPPPKPGTAAEAQAATDAQYREASVMGRPRQPVYPPRALAAKAGAATVGVKLFIGADGAVTELVPSVWVFSTPGPFAGEFRRAVEEAVRTWRFQPARIEHLEYVTEGEFILTRVTRTEFVESELELAFQFTPGVKEARTKEAR